MIDELLRTLGAHGVRATPLRGRSASHRRLLLHRAVAATLEDAAGHRRERAASLAHHFELGQVWDKALHYLADAADCSRDLFAVREAVQFYDRAIELANRIPDLAETQLFRMLRFD